jgi:hypothetical protein
MRFTSLPPFSLGTKNRFPDLVFATHDRRQALAAEALGFDVIGL